MNLENLKLMLQLKDGSQDDLLKLIADNTEKALKFKLGLTNDTTIPPELDYIVLEVAIKRYNRLNNEGMSQYSQEGESITFDSNDFAEFADDIAVWKDNHDKQPQTLGRISFINGFGGDKI